jgi:hypothetical protein
VARTLSRDGEKVRTMIGSYPSDLHEQEWSGRRESNPRLQLGKLSFYH